jgi:membrane-bound acyltransferase YfiQ involved in biofilm formation
MFGAIYIAMWVGCLLGIPALVVYSIREWASTDRRTLPSLRSRIGVVSVGAIFCGWLFLFVLTILEIFNDRWIDFFTEQRNVIFLVLAVTASLTSLTLKNARVQAVAAGVFLILWSVLWLSRDMP